MKRIVDAGMFPGTYSSYELVTFEEILLLPFIYDHKKKIPCILISAAQGSPFFIIYAHGNGSDIGDIYQKLKEYSSLIPAHIMAFDYPGYGKCEGKADEASVDACLWSVFGFVRNMIRWPDENILFWGCSIGTGPVTRAASVLTMGRNNSIIYSRKQCVDEEEIESTMSCNKNEFSEDIIDYVYEGQGGCDQDEVSVCENESQTEDDMKDDIENDDEENELIKQFSIGYSNNHLFNDEPKTNLKDIPLGGLILQCPYCSIPQAATSIIGNLAYLLVTHRWNIEDEILMCSCPILFIHGKKDTLFDWRGSLKMYKKYCQIQPNKAECHFPDEASHHEFDLFLDIINPIKGFLNKFLKPKKIRISNKIHTYYCKAKNRGLLEL